MDVGVYVTELLHMFDEVSLSGIGTFYKKRTSAYFDNKQGIFFPPSQEFAFDADKTSGTTDLIKYVCEVRNISEPSARYFIEKYVDTIKQSLQIKGFAVIDSIGKLRTANSSFVFEPTPIEDNSSSYGLIPVMDIERKGNNKNNTEPDFSAIRFKAPAPQAPEQQQAATEKKPKEEKSYKSAIFIVITFLALGAAIVAGYLVFPRFFQPQDNKKQNLPSGAAQRPGAASTKKPDSLAEAGSKSLKESEANADSLFDKSITQLGQEQGITVEKARDTNNISINPVPASNSKKNRDSVASVSATSNLTRYEIITAAFNKKSEAEEHISKLRKKGIDASIVVDNKKPKFKISMGGFTNEEAAHKERRRIQEKIAKDAWVLTIKNK